MTKPARAVPSAAALELPIDLIDESPFNPRKTFEGLDELAESIRTKGVLQPGLVRPVGQRYELVYGHRRLRAARLAGLRTYPAIVRELSDAQVLEVQIVENAQRADVHPLEEADGFLRLQRDHGYTIEDLAAKTGKTKRYVYERLRLTTLCPEARELFLEGKLSLATALIVSTVLHPERQARAAEEVATNYGRPMTAREASHLVREQFLLSLADAPFNAGDAKLLPAAGACTTCPQRTGNQAVLFVEDVGDDRCLDEDCFAAKTEAAWHKRVKNAPSSGERVLSDEETKCLFPRGDTWWMEGSTYVRATERCWEAGSDKNWKDVLGDAAPQLVIARVGRSIVELYVRADAKKALADSLRPKKEATAGTGGDDDEPAERHRDPRDTWSWHQAFSKLLAAELSAAAEKLPRRIVLELVVRDHINAGADDNHELAARHGIAPEDERASVHPIIEALPKLSENTLQAIAVDLACRGLTTDELAKVCESAGLDIDALRRQADTALGLGER